ncbi:DUF2750 domain-containing protein [Gynuella sunshinyii]|uniref:DUF2750 domain-containing protein n=1 Tax=Gynuella sunshinyii YC6258 TaxID=1445510 RepID=A0A0C5VF97_9GAMM|nr:DUF2750 domain-containing protein [Gynuella sunshinyii]AJQ92083.1 hypothetical Protein YC6258_00027 [Gynuella sunshinyii YC6258]
MSSDPSTNLLGLDCEERYDYFLTKVAEEREVWILVNQEELFLKNYTEDNSEYVLVWPDESLARAYSKDLDGFSPRSIPLPQFFNKWIPGLTQDDIDIGVFPGLDDDLWVASPAELETELKAELANQF